MRPAEVVIIVLAVLLVALVVAAARRKEARLPPPSDLIIEVRETAVDLLKPIRIAPNQPENPFVETYSRLSGQDVLIIQPEQADWDLLVDEFGVRQTRLEEVLSRVNWYLPAALLGIPQKRGMLSMPLDVWWPYGLRQMVLVTNLAPKGIERMTVHRIELGWQVIVLSPPDLERTLRGEIEPPDGFGNRWTKIA